MDNGAPFVFAGLGSRLAAFAIDCFVLCVAMYGVGYAGGTVAALLSPNPDLEALLVSLNVAAFVVWLGYFVGMEASPWRGTVGKRLMSIAVARPDGARISVLSAFVRQIVKAAALFTFFIAYLMALFTRKRQALHDKAANTVVIKVPRKQSAAPSPGWHPG